MTAQTRPRRNGYRVSVSTSHNDNIHHIHNVSEESDVFISQDDKVFLRATEHLSGSVNQPG